MFEIVYLALKALQYLSGCDGVRSIGHVFVKADKYLESSALVEGHGEGE